MPDNDEERFAPGSFGCHEALHMTSFLMQAIDTDLMEHPAIAARPDWKATAEVAFNALYDLYQAIGREHL